MQPVEDSDETEITLWVNEPKDSENRESLESLLTMYYLASNENKIGLAKFYHVAEEKEVICICGIDFSREGDVLYFPIAKVFDQSEMMLLMDPEKVEEDLGQ